LGILRKCQEAELAELGWEITVTVDEFVGLSLISFNIL
jgi:hypothetical protein